MCFATSQSGHRGCRIARVRNGCSNTQKKRCDRKSTLADRTLPVRLGVVTGSRRIARCLREYIGMFIVVDAATDNAIEPGRHVGSS